MNPLTNSLMVRAADTPAIKPAVELGAPLLLTILGLAGFLLAYEAWIRVGGLGV